MDVNSLQKGPASAGPLFDVVGKLVGYLMAFALITLVTLVGGEVILRAVANSSFGFVEELTGYLVVALTLFGAALALRSNTLFRVGFIFSAFPKRVQKLLWYLFIGISLFVCAVLAWKSYQLVGSSLTRGKFAPTVLRTPLWIPQVCMPLGFLTIGLFLIEQFLLSLRPEQREG